MEDLKIEGWPHVFASLDIFHRFERESDLAKIAQVSKLCRDAVNEYRKKWKATLKSRFPELARFPSMLTAYARLHRYCQGVANLLSGNVQSTIVETPVAPLTVLHFAPLLNRGSLESAIRLDTFQLRRPKQFWKLESSEIREIPRDGVASLFTLQILQTELIDETSWLVPKEGSGPFTIEIGESEAAVWSKDGEVLQHDLVGGPYLESGAFLRFVRDNDYIFQITIDRDDYYDPETKEIGDVGSLIVAGVILREKGGDRSLVVLVCQDGEVHLRDGEAKRHLLTLTLPTPIINTTPSLDYRVFNRSIVSTFDRNTDKIHVKFKEDISGLFCW